MEETSDVKNVLGDRTRRGLEILQAALIIGIFGDSLLRATPWGLNFFLWVTMITVGLWAIVTRHREEKTGVGTIALHGGLIFFAAMFVWRDSIQLLVADFMAILVIFAILTLPVMKFSLAKSGFIHYALGWAYSSFNAAIAPFFLLLEDIKWNGAGKGKSTRIFAAVGKGLAVAIPLVLVFGALFVAADAAYERLVRETFRFDIEEVISHLLVITFLSWGVAGYFRGAEVFIFERFITKPKTDELSILLDKVDQEEKEKEEKKKSFAGMSSDEIFPKKLFTLGSIELGVILGLTNLLFLSFVIVQIPYLFGGMDLVRNTQDLSLADYARRGFGELVAVAALVLPMLLATHWLIRKEDKRSLMLYRVLAVVQIVLMFVVMISAAQRMLLYTGTSGYGLTTTRFYPMVFMIWLTFVFFWFGATVLRGGRRQFAWGTVWSALGFLAVLHFFNPDNFIARTNFALMHSGRSFDARYINELSDDAVPAVIDELSNVDGQQKCVLLGDLKARYYSDTKYEPDLRSWNWSRRNAVEQIAPAIEGFESSRCNSAEPPEPVEIER